MTPTTSLLLSTPVDPAPVADPNTATRAEFGRLLHAAIISPRYRCHLLSNPLSAIETGYMGESFQFSGDVKNQIRQIQAGTLDEFASRLLQIVEVHSTSEMAVLHY